MDPMDCAKAIREMQGKYLGTRPMKITRSKWDDLDIKQVFIYIFVFVYVYIHVYIKKVFMYKHIDLCMYMCIISWIFLPMHAL
jgi:hypothetical protein